jgi:hypothetical protein
VGPQKIQIEEHSARNNGFTYRLTFKRRLNVIVGFYITTLSLCVCMTFGDNRISFRLVADTRMIYFSPEEVRSDVYKCCYPGKGFLSSHPEMEFSDINLTKTRVCSMLVCLLTNFSRKTESALVLNTYKKGEANIFVISTL